VGPPRAGVTLGRSGGDREVARVSLSAGGDSSWRLAYRDGAVHLVRLESGDRFLAHGGVLGEPCGHGGVWLEALRCSGPI
jgi:hypothetical protein